jgi:hypothetical protein
MAGYTFQGQPANQMQQPGQPGIGAFAWCSNGAMQVATVLLILPPPLLTLLYMQL